MALASVRGNFAAKGTSGTIMIPGMAYYALSLWGSWTGEVYLERSPDNGVTWYSVRNTAAKEYFDATDFKVGLEPVGALYRLRCFSFTTGDILYLIEVGAA